VALPLADLLAKHWKSYVQAHPGQVHADHHRAVRRVLACRTEALGGRLYQCEGCQTKHYAYHSCNHRNCPQCGALDQQIWAARQEARLLPVPYFMVTFTLPAELRGLCLRHPQILYPLLLRQSAAAIQDVTATKYKGARLGFTSVLHTWGRQMQHHPHVHLIVPGVALGAGNDTLHHPARDSFLLPFRPLAERFRSLVQSTLKSSHPDIQKTLTREQLHALSSAKTWNVQLQHAGSGRTALRYLARYVQRSAFHAKRLLGYDKHGNVLLRWTSSSTGTSAVMTLSPHEFIRRWLLHVLPKGLTRVRHYGYLSSAAAKSRLRVRALLGRIGEPAPVLPALKPFTCSCCGGNLTFLREIAASRAPP
jgi:hypothetical protein